MRPSSRRLLRLKLGLGFGFLGVCLSAGILAAPQQAFRSSVDVIPIDVQVLDSEGMPIAGLEAADFEVRIDRDVRQVVSVDFRQYGYQNDPRSITPIRPGVTATNLYAPVGPPERIFVLAVDASSLSDHESSGMIGALEGFVRRLAPEDAVGFFTLPHGPSLLPTTNRVALREVIRTIVGAAGLRAGALNLSPFEVTEIVNSPENPFGSSPAPPPSSGPRSADPNDVFRQLQMRECGTTRETGCSISLMIEAQNLQRQLEQEAAETIAGVKTLLSALSDYVGQKTIVLVSSGMPLSDSPGGWNSFGGEAATIGAEAARSRVSIYSLHVDRGLSRAFAPEVQDIRVATSRSLQLEERVLYELASSSGGALFSVSVDSGERALTRLLIETSSQYLLGVSPAELDMDGRTHTLTVTLKTDRAGTIARHRKFVFLRDDRLPAP